MLGLGMSLGGHAGSSATDVSDNGSVVVGNIGLTSFRWTASSGLVDLNAASAAAVSADGSTVVGTHAAPHGTEAYRWTQSGGIANLGFLPGQTQSFARDVSADGSVVVGHSGPGAMPFRWTDGLGMVALDTPCLVCNGYAIGVSSDGSIVVGGSETSAGVGFPFIWDEINGMRDIRQILVDEGIDLSGWTLGMPTGVSADGLTILGAGTNPSGIQNYWVASLPPPISVPTSNWFLMSLLALLLAATGFQAFQSTDFRSA